MDFLEENSPMPNTTAYVKRSFFLKILVFTKNKVESEAMDTLPVCPRTKLNIRHKNYSSNMAWMRFFLERQISILLILKRKKGKIPICIACLTSVILVSSPCWLNVFMALLVRHQRPSGSRHVRWEEIIWRSWILSSNHLTLHWCWSPCPCVWGWPDPWRC